MPRGTGPTLHAANSITRASPAVAAFGALGVVFGDIGTSPLYAFRESLASRQHHVEVTDANILGVLSLIVWALILVVTVKYLVIVMRADNHGEGGILALTALVQHGTPSTHATATHATATHATSTTDGASAAHGSSATGGAAHRPANHGGATDGGTANGPAVNGGGARSGSGRKRTAVLILAGLFGTALLYGDGMITPAISVLSAVEGLKVAAPAVESWVEPIAAVILVGLFAIQRRGTAAIGGLFGPVMTVWFLVLGVLGATKIVSEPSVVRAVDPLLGLRFLIDNGFVGFLVLGSVFLVVTGGEALYADMGHFGRVPITLAWYWFVLPALVLNYFGQGALLLDQPEAVENPFYLMAPSWAQWPLTILATMATVIASQALITGAFSLTVQAINLDYLPRLRVVQTSSESRGQVYVPSMNWLLCVVCVALVFAFGSSTRLAAAYGVAVTLTMVVTTVIVARVAQIRWHWSPIRIAAVLTPLLVVDVSFATANLFKIPEGGWFPLAVGLIGFTGFTTWHTGRRLVADRIQKSSRPLDDLAAQIAIERPTRQAGTGVYLHRTPGCEPPALIANLKLNNSLHEQVVALTVVTTDDPQVPPDERAVFVNHDYGIHELALRYGFIEQPDITADLAALKEPPVAFDPTRTTFFLGRERLDVTEHPGMARWREHLFAFLHRNAADPAAHFHLPPDRTLDIGQYVEL